MVNLETHSSKGKILPKWTKACRDCSAVIGFHSEVKSPNGSLRPLDLNGDFHFCPNSDYARRQLAAKKDLTNEEEYINQAIAYVAECSKHLSKSTLRVVMEGKA